MQNSSHILQDQVRQAYTEKKPLAICGGNSKYFYGNPVSAERLEISSHTGIISHEPLELTITARAGTPLSELEAVLEAHNQRLAFEPPHFSGTATVGGMIAAGLSGPSRAFHASLQDSVLGCTVLNGKGECLSFGGKVMKNVAGYDVSRLLVGSLGCLGIILDVTLKVIPSTTAEATYSFIVERGQSAAFSNELRKQGLPVSGTCYLDNEFLVRFSAGQKELDSLPEVLAKKYSFIQYELSSNKSFWDELREHKLPFFSMTKSSQPLWRLSVPPDTDIASLKISEGKFLSEWGNTLHWIRTNIDAAEIFNTIEILEGHATLFRIGGDKSQVETFQRFQPRSPVLLNWHKQLKLAFDPAGILNPGKMFQEF